MSAHREGANDDLCKWKTAKPGNIESIMESLIDWIKFNDGGRNDSVDSSNVVSQLNSSKDRYIMLTVCSSGNLWDQQNNEALTCLKDALMNFICNLNNQDYLCLNIGNSS